MALNLEAWAEDALYDLKAQDNLRSLSPITSAQGPRITRRGDPLWLFSSNDYLGLSQHPEVIGAARRALETWGLGPRAAALLAGYTEHHEALEAALSEFKRTEQTYLCPTGFSANLAAISAFASSETVYFSDALNHASIIDACNLAKLRGARVEIYPHGDVFALEALLRTHRKRRKIVITESYFSMDGDLAPLDRIYALTQKNDAALFVDESHANLVLGPNGTGGFRHRVPNAAPDLEIGTLSKAFGAQGGFITGKKVLCDWVLNRGRAMFFSTALPVPVVAAAHQALRTALRGEQLAALQARVTAMQQLFARPELIGPIVTIVQGSDARVLAARDHLRQKGFDVSAVRPPTVPEGEARLRITLSALHPLEILEPLADAVLETLQT